MDDWSPKRIHLEASSKAFLVGKPPSHVSQGESVSLLNPNKEKRFAVWKRACWTELSAKAVQLMPCELAKNVYSWFKE